MNWINELSIQRRSLYSNGLIAQTDDCQRVSELLRFMKAKYPEPIMAKEREGKPPHKWIPERWVIFDGWEGLDELVLGVDNRWGEKHLGDAKQLGGEPRSLLKKISDELAINNTVLVIQNLLESDKYLNNALRSWSTSDSIRAAGSTVIVFVEDISLFPQNVWSKMKIIDVPKSLEHERIQILDNRQKEMKARPILDEMGLKGASRICAGMNHDQTDAAVIESILREHTIDLNTLARTKTELISKDPSIDIIQQPKFGFEAIGGYDALKIRLKEDIIMPIRNPEMAEEYNMKPPRGAILYGPSGTGKTVLVKAMSKELNMSVLIFRPENVLSKFVGESERALKKTFKIADSMAPCIFFVDEIDRLAKRAATTGSDGGAQVHREIFSMFLEKLGDENREWFFVGTTNRVDDIDDAMRRTGRIDCLAPVPYPSEKARKEIFKIHAIVKRKLPLADDVSFKQLAGKRYTYMWAGSDIEQLVIRVANYVMKDAIRNKKKRKITMADFEYIWDTFNINASANEELQEKIKLQAEELTNDKRLMDIFDEAQKVEAITRGEKAKEAMKYTNDQKLPSDAGVT